MHFNAAADDDDDADVGDDVVDDGDVGDDDDGDDDGDDGDDDNDDYDDDGDDNGDGEDENEEYDEEEEEKDGDGDEYDDDGYDNDEDEDDYDDDDDGGAVDAAAADDDDDDERKMRMWMLRRRKMMKFRMDDVQEGDRSQDRREAHFVRACAVEMHTDISQEFFFVGKFSGKVQYANPGTPVSCEPAQSKRTWTCHKSHFVWQITGEMGYATAGHIDTTSNEHPALTLAVRTPQCGHTVREILTCMHACMHAHIQLHTYIFIYMQI